ncbi:HK97-gp10 family putative phage morphogenesis protein [Enterobacter roggenkampii]|uniref:HK97-gp10 family putative phage morphogenesis protein n=1 Tax=Enterobacter roggenkampii TaxID=1812935 RepID=UPI00399B8C0D
MKELSSLMDAALTFAAAKIAVQEHAEKALAQVAEQIKKTAQDEIGFYQPAVGPFAAWEDLADSTEQEKARLGYPLNAPLERTGKMRDSIKAESEGLEAIVGSEEEKLAFHEFGTVKMPPRPVLGPAVIHNEAAIKGIIGRAAVNAICGGDVVHPSLGYGKDL